MIQNLFGAAALKAQPRKALATTLLPTRTEIEFALVLVESESDQQLGWVIGAVTEATAEFGGTALQVAGALIYVAFSGVAGAGPHPERQRFAAHITASQRQFVRVLHGRASALVGSVGSPARMSYTAIPDGFADMLRKLSLLPPGTTEEYVSE